MSELKPVHTVAECYAQTASYYQSKWSPVIHPIGRKLLETLPLDRAGRVLDAGTGVGSLIGDIRELAPEATIVGVDLSEDMLREARRNAAVPLAAMDVRRLALAPATFDVAVMPFMLFHVPEPDEALREMHRIVRPGGTLGVVTWGEDPPYPAAQAFEDEMKTAGGGDDPLPVVSTHELMDTPERIEGLLEDAGFEPARIWVEPHAHRWDPEDFKWYLAYGSRRRRLEPLPPDVRNEVVRRVHERLDTLDDEGWTYRFTTVVSVARRP